MRRCGFLMRLAQTLAETGRAWALVVALLLPASEGWSSTPTCLPDVINEDAARFSALLSSLMPERRVEGVQGLANLKHRPAESAVIRLLDDAAPAVRREALLALGRLGGIRTIPRFIELLDHPSWEIRQNAWLALGRMTAQNFGPTEKAAWEKWWVESTSVQKEQTLLNRAGGPPEHGAGGTNTTYVTAAPGRRGRARNSLLPPAHSRRHDALRALVHLATPSSEDALLRFLQQPQSPPLDADERNFICEALERLGSSRAIPVLAAQRSDAAAWALGSLGGAEAERALLEFAKTLPTLLALDRLHSTNAGPFLPMLVEQMGQITYRGQPDDVMNEEMQPIQRAGANLIRRSGLAPVFFECVLQELEDTMQPPVTHGPRPAAPSSWDGMFKRMRSELKPGFVREDGTTTSQPVVALCYTADDPALGRRLIPLLRHPAVVIRVYVALTLGRLRVLDALPAMSEMIREGYTFSDSVALASGIHFDQSQTVRWRGFVCLALGRMAGTDARMALESFAVNSKQPRDIRYGAVVGLGFIGSPESLPVLERVTAEDLIWLVRDEAKQVARKIRLRKLEERP